MIRDLTYRLVACIVCSFMSNLGLLLKEGLPFLVTMGEQQPKHESIPQTYLRLQTLKQATQVETCTLNSKSNPSHVPRGLRQITPAADLQASYGGC